MIKTNQKPFSLPLAGLIAAVLLGGCESASEPASDLPSTATENISSIANADDWAFNGLNRGENRHSPLTDINKDNIDQLGLAWQFNDFVVRGRVHRGNQGTPLVVDGKMYFTGPWSVVYAVNAATGKKLWTYNPEVKGEWARKACCDVNNKGVAIKDGKLYVGVVDGYLDAVDIATGKRLWRADTLVDRSKSYTVTGAPRIAGKNIVIGNGGSDMDARGYVTAYNLETGKMAWRFYTVPGDPKLGEEHPELEIARKTWGDNSRWDLGGGGTVYDGMSYDPELNLIYVGTSNGVPHPTWLRDPSGGDNLFLSSILALDADTGRMKWHYQTTPSDDWDFGSTQNIILSNVKIGGVERKVLMQAPKNGFFYVLDRETGELLSAEKFTIVTWAKKIDMATGRPVLDKSLNYKDSPKIIWPSVSGGHNWQPMAYSPETKLVYIPVLEGPMKYVAYDGVEYLPDSLNEGKGPPLMPPFEKEDDKLLKGQPKPVEHSILKAWDPVTQKEVWRSEPQTWWSGGVLSTAGGLVLQGSVDGYFTVYDAKTGAVLKKINTGVATLAPPMTYRVDGVQYIAVLAGLGGSESAYYPKRSAARKYENPESLFVFKLDGGEVNLPPLRTKPEQLPLPAKVDTSNMDMGRAAEQFFHHCARCHSYRGSKGSYPNLWNMSESSHAAFDQIVGDGVFKFSGMAPFSDVLTQPEQDAIHAFIINDAHKARASTDDEDKRVFMENL